MQRRAPAKINLSLHITGRRADGYHLLDSVVAFAADAFDRVEAEAAPTLHLAVDGGVPIQDNLVAQAAALLQKDSGISKGAALHLTKRLPVSGGIGGGSADAAATLHLLNELWQLRYPVEKLASLGEKIGADVPVCVHGKACRMQGIGEKITPITLPELHAVLVNPGVAVETRAVFAAGISAGEAIPPMEKDVIRWLASQRNDLTPFAIKLAPVIGEALQALEYEGALLARMSGSGATCFGLFNSKTDAEKAAEKIKKVHPGWWVVATLLV